MAQPEVCCNVSDEVHFICRFEVARYRSQHNAVLRFLYLASRSGSEAIAITHEIGSKSPGDSRDDWHEGLVLEPRDRVLQAMDEFELFQLPPHFAAPAIPVVGIGSLGYLSIRDVALGIQAFEICEVVVANPRSSSKAFTKRGGGRPRSIPDGCERG